MKYDDIINEYNFKNKKVRKNKPYFSAQRRYDLFFSQLDREEEDRKLIERYRSQLQYI